MSGANSFGRLFRVTTFGESHGGALGAVIDGCPAGVVFRDEILREALERRRPGQGAEVSGRAEDDEFEILSGIFERRTLGTPIAVIVRNKDARSQDYDAIRASPRAGHADDVWSDKFGHRDHRGGGRSSGRETLARVIGGAFAKMMLLQVTDDGGSNLATAGNVSGDKHGIAGENLSGGENIISAENSAFPGKSQESENTIHAANAPVNVLAFPRRVGPVQILDSDLEPGGRYNLSAPKIEEITRILTAAKAEGESFGGIAEVWVQNPPKSLGQPVFHKLKADLAAAMMSIGATSGFELGAGFAAAKARGTEFHGVNEETQTNAKNSHNLNYGGIRGGISTGETIVFRVAFKPTSSILDIAKKGRHDPCIVLRALAVVEAMTWLVLADHELWRRLDRVIY